ncbi:hypothetical protein OCK74_18735 [Chitinophagaceae bacterium LB-8]|uniref:Heparinase II/III-like protein n=1 Tax=Paraflavisolibacter caeni TaxID=2982496 RepID=A0A9X2XX83_9BACT|nr:hypothetical protein [Paraflavisolibacter caeni]MCU7551164.1 hypothetical protein [Paraflavisolibacter caeni]
MKKINRGAFLMQSLKASAGVLLTPSLLTKASAMAQSPSLKDDLFNRMVLANDTQVEKLLQTNFDKREFSRKIGYDLGTLVASYCCETSKYYHVPSLLAPLQKLSQHLLHAQTADGTVNVGNLESPPDTAFIVEIVTAAVFPLQKENSEALSDLKGNLKTFLLKAGDGLIAGGVHTPNHRWVISAALARINALYPNKKYVDRIEDWLGEGIYINSDGNYPERSRIYSYVENTAFLTMARLLNKPSLFEPVKKNLDTTYYYMEPNGDLVANDSRRQDQYHFIQPDPNSPLSILNYYMLYRYMAIRENNSTFAAIAIMMEQMKGFEERVLNRDMIYFLEEPLLQKELPAAVTPLVNYEKLFAQSHLLRMRNGAITTTFFGGVDWPIMIASGRSNSPDFYSYRKGNAILKYMRLSTSFFSTGYFYSEGLKKAGNNYILHKKLTVPYYQPLPKKFRKTDGDYQLSPSIDDRFWNKMDFEHRPTSNVKTLETTISLSETNGSNELAFEVTGQAGVQVTIELCFKEGGKLIGVSESENGNSFLEQGMGQYEFGGDVIQFGPGTVSQKSIRNLEGERYSSHFGSLRTEGMHVYLTGLTPFTHKLTFS